MAGHEPVFIDGSRGEGGGQMLRTALAMSAVSGIQFAMGSIRANRPKPGLARQHLAALELASRICNAEITGGRVGSARVEFSPGRVRHGEYQVDVGSAGSVTLVLQAVLPALASVKGSSTIVLKGGTDVKWSPPADYYALVLFPALARMGLECDIDIRRRGYFPRGGGEVVVRVRSRGALEPLAPARSGPGHIRGIINITGLPLHIARRMEATVTGMLPQADIEIRQRTDGPGQGVGIVLAADYGDAVLGASALGEKGKKAEMVAREAASMLVAEMDGGCTVDLHMADQLLPYIAMASGEYTARALTRHASTNAWVIGRFLGGRIDITGDGPVRFLAP